MAEPSSFDELEEELIEDREKSPELDVVGGVPPGLGSLTRAVTRQAKPSTIYSQRERQSTAVRQRIRFSEAPAWQYQPSSWLRYDQYQLASGQNVNFSSQAQISSRQYSAAPILVTRPMHAQPLVKLKRPTKAKANNNSQLLQCARGLSYQKLPPGGTINYSQVGSVPMNVGSPIGQSLNLRPQAKVKEIAQMVGTLSARKQIPCKDCACCEFFIELLDDSQEKLVEQSIEEQRVHQENKDKMGPRFSAYRVNINERTIEKAVNSVTNVSYLDKNAAVNSSIEDTNIEHLSNAVTSDSISASESATTGESLINYPGLSPSEAASLEALQSVSREVDREVDAVMREGAKKVGQIHVEGSRPSSGRARKRPAYWNAYGDMDLTNEGEYEEYEYEKEERSQPKRANAKSARQ